MTYHYPYHLGCKLAIVQDNFVWETFPGSKSLEAIDEGLHGHVWGDVEMYHSHYTTCVKADPGLLALCDVVGLDVQW